MEFLLLADNSQLRKFHNFSIEYSGKVAQAITGCLESFTQGDTSRFSSLFILIDWSQFRKHTLLDGR